MEPLGEKLKVPAHTVDISSQGARIQTGIPLVPGQVLVFVTSEGPEHALRCQVVWTGAIGSDREGEAGLSFLHPQPSAV